MKITLRQLTVFEAVARNLSYTRAAAELHLSQPAVSMQIRQLEEHAGLPLFEQLGKKIYLTEAGQEMLHYSRIIGQQLKEAKEVFAQLKGSERGRLDIAVASTANSFAPHLLARFCKQHPNITFNLDVTNRDSLLTQLAANEKDIVIMGKPPENMDLEYIDFMDNPLVVIAAPDHPLAEQPHIPLQALAQQSFVVREPVSGTRMAVERFFRQHHIYLPIIMETTRNEAIKQAVSAGLGLGIVSLHTVQLELAAECLIVLKVASFPILRYWYIVHRRGKRLSPIAQTFKDYVIQEARQIWPVNAKLYPSQG